MPPEQALVAVEPVRGVPAEIQPVESMLQRIRADWRAKRLIERVRALLYVDPSSACQRLLNAAILDLRKKIVVAGIDLAGEAAKIHRLPPVTKADDVLENYSTTNTLDLAYRMGLLKRPEWRRLVRAYDIRRDLEHEDDEYEAQVEDCVYVFAACIDTVLSRDPIELIRVDDVKAAIETSEPVSLSPDLLEDYGRAPEVRQTDIVRMLVGVARSDRQPDIVRQNAMEVLRDLERLTMDKVKIAVAAEVHESLEGRPLGAVEMKVCAAAGAVSYLKQRRVAAFFANFVRDMSKIPPDWGSHSRHANILDLIEDYGGLRVIPADQLRPIMSWLVRCYLGEKGGYGAYGRNRSVFYSDVAAPIIERLVKASNGDKVRSALEDAAGEKRVQALIEFKPIARRLEWLRDLVGDDSAA
jgi:hypothetical protein